MNIDMRSNGTVVATATLDDNPSARDFMALLPLDLTLEDYEATEKIADLPRALSARHAPPGHAPSEGDISYYAPWGNLAIFHRDDDYAAGLVRLGRLKSGVEAFRRGGAMVIRIDRARP